MHARNEDVETDFKSLAPHLPCCKAKGTVPILSLSELSISYLYTWNTTLSIVTSCLDVISPTPFGMVVTMGNNRSVFSGSTYEISGFNVTTTLTIKNEEGYGDVTLKIGNSNQTYLMKSGQATEAVTATAARTSAVPTTEMYLSLITKTESGAEWNYTVGDTVALASFRSAYN